MSDAAANLTCAQCGGTSSGYKKANGRKYCSVACTNAAHGSMSRYPGLPTGTVGAIGEYRVAIDLMAKGFEVFRAASPHCSCDLAVLRNGRLLRLEVKTGYRTKSGGLIMPKPTARQIHDVLAIAIGDEVVYQPPEGEWPT